MDATKKKADVNFEMKPDHGELSANEAVTFSSLVLSFASSALVYLGEFPSPTGETVDVNPLLAKQNIDILTLLKQKTQGNLSADETSMLDSILYDLKMKYVTKVAK